MLEFLARLKSRVSVNLVIAVLVCVELMLCGLIIWKVPYTEIDWRAYMQEVEGYLSGERNYYSLGGDTGPLVYPAGFVYVFAGLRSLTDDGINIFKGQIIFAAIDVAVLIAVLLLYKSGKSSDWLWWPLLLLSKRVHSIFVLRLFNDCLAVLFGYVAFNLFLSRKWRWGCLLYSFAVSIKMNMLLYAPGILWVLLLGTGFKETSICLSICAGVQLVLGYPFLSTYPIPYIARSFDLGRVFMFKWTVNFKFIQEDIFTSKSFSLALLFLTAVAFVIFGIKWIVESSIAIGREKREGKRLSIGSIIAGDGVKLSPNFVVVSLFTSNFIGIALARSLHYQFYCWYFFSLPYLLCHTALPAVFKLAVLLGIEIAFNVYPATPTSSLLLQACHAILLFGLYMAPVPSPITAADSALKKKL